MLTLFTSTLSRVWAPPAIEQRAPLHFQDTAQLRQSNQLIVVPVAPVHLADYDIPSLSCVFVDNGVLQLLDIIDDLGTVLTEVGVDFEIRTTKLKFKCVSYVGGYAVKFVVRFFRLTPDEQSFFDTGADIILSIERMVEVQLFDWQRLVGTLVSQLARRNSLFHTKFNALARSHKSAHAASLANAPAGGTHSIATLGVSGVERMLRHAQSSNVDVKEQALAALSCISQDANAAILLRRLGALELLCKMCMEPDQQVATSAVTSIANICSRGQFSSEWQYGLVLHCGLQLLRSLVGEPGYLAIQLKREAARTMSELTNASLAQGISQLERGQILNVLAHHCKGPSQDHHLMQHCFNAKKNLEATSQLS